MIRPGRAVIAPDAPERRRVRSGRPTDVGSDGNPGPDQSMLVVSVVPVDPTWRVRPPDGGSIVLVLVGTCVCWLYHHEVAEC